ncbi:NADH-quinone oxidoreductase subunit M [Microbispora triticiradicis]|uniref:NADH-quinone oxidoreductase subunit M n=3 Tax=Microbispora TaxID=2005 RepID=A0ABY3M5L7_9ACTN|nr:MULTISPECIES: NADH-quinone oxidoreductase subunit M [Microbispora]GLW23641.1 NADH-quinone oxidoreductase subunit M [Microbispora amethystogenes]MBO4269324.1 NADH-quinone oxidoreductase subunit M [Microbispora triticiradicis]RGA04056.1 NADH-quinone oxidoreductase subunit M [Microbispora triticiradicis]TLP66194.1 NADH-quinone oxidoreductase subunit M [Microbispora fusca]TYB67978.1 NADH-quinone oxidoreductase subunit M [Microbispora tritici]
MPWLSTLMGVSVLGALGVTLVRNDKLAKQFTLVVSLIVLALTVAMAVQFSPNGDKFQFAETYDWIPAFGVHYGVAVDGIALVLILLSVILVPIVVLASWHDAEAGKRSVRTYFSLLLVLEAMMIGVFAATDVFLFYVFFEAMLIPMYFMIGSYGGAQRSYAAVKFLLYSLFGGLLMLVAVIALYSIAGKGTFMFTDLVGTIQDVTTQKWLFLGFFVAFAIKAPLWPFHTWLPDAAAQAPAGAAVLLVGVLDKVGTYGMLRFCLELFPDAAKFFTPLVITLSVIGIVYGAIVAIGQTDMKRLIAYTSVSHFGFIAMGVFAMTTNAGSGATLYMVNHGFSTGALFLVAGFLIYRRGSQFISDYGGVQKVAPILAGTFLVAGLSSLSLPGLSTFVSEFMVLIGTYERYLVPAVIATTGVILAAIYILWMYQRTMNGPTAESVKALPDLNAREKFVVAPLIALLLVFGFYPKPLLDVINPAVKDTLSSVSVTDPKPAVPVAQEGK